MVRRLGLLALVLLALGGCAEFFELNLLAALESSPKIPSAADLSALEAEDSIAAVLDSLSNDLDSPAFISQLKENAEEREAVKDYLKSKFTDPPAADDPQAKEDYQLAAMLFAEVTARSTGAHGVVNNVFSVILDGGLEPEVDQSDDDFVASFVNQILPDQTGKTALEKKTEVMGIINGLIEANDAYTALSSTLDPIDGEVTVPPDANMGGAAQTALAAFMVASVADSANGDVDPALAVYNLVINNDNSGFSDGGVVRGDPFVDEGLSNILAAAGLGDLLSSFRGGV